METPQPQPHRRRKKKTFLQLTRSRVISGLVLVVPLMVTLFAARFLYERIAGFTNPITKRLVEAPFWQKLDEKGWNLIDIVPGIDVVITLVVTFFLLYLLGFLSSLFVTRKIYQAGEGLLMRIPLLKDIYGLTKQVIDLVASKRQVAFKQVGLVEYPHPGMYVMAFIAGETRISEHPGEVYVQALMPFAPIPTQLILFVVSASKVHVLDLPMDTAMKFLMSGGSVSPGEFKTHPYVSPTPESVSSESESNEEEEYEDEETAQG